jgi:hypothetical protein
MLPANDSTMNTARHERCTDASAMDPQDVAQSVDSISKPCSYYR